MNLCPPDHCFSDENTALTPLSQFECGSFKYKYFYCGFLFCKVNSGSSHEKYFLQVMARMYVVYELLARSGAQVLVNWGPRYPPSFVSRENISERQGENALVQHAGWFEELTEMSAEEAMEYLGYIPA